MRLLCTSASCSSPPGRRPGGRPRRSVSRTARADSPSPRQARPRSRSASAGRPSRTTSTRSSAGRTPRYEIWSLNYDFLFGFGENGGEPTLDLAREFPTEENGGISADGKVWTIKLRTGVKWSDGQPITADDVAFTYNYVVKNQHAEHGDHHGRHRGRQGPRPGRRADHLLAAQGRHGAHLPAHPAQARLGEGRRPRRRRRATRTSRPIVGTGPFITTEFKKGGFVQAWSATPTTGASGRRSTRSSSSTTRTPTR